MARNSRVSLTVDILGNVTDLNNSLKTVQNNLSKLKLPTNISNNFNNLFARLSKEIETFQSKASSTIRTTSDMRAIEKSGDKIIDLYRRLTMQVQNLNSLSDRQKAELIPSDSLNKMSKLQEGIKVYRSTVESLTKQEQKETAELRKQEDTLKRLKQTKEQLENEQTIPAKEARAIKDNLDSAIKAYNDAQAKLQEINEKIERDLADPTTKLKRNADGSLNKTSKLGKQYFKELAAAQNNVEAARIYKIQAEEKFRSMPKTVSSHESDLKKINKSIAETEAAISRVKESIAKIDVSAGTMQALEKLKSQLAGIDGIDVNTINSIEDLDKILQELGSDAASEASEKLEQLFNILEQGQGSADGMKEDIHTVSQSFEEMIEQQSGIDDLKRSLASFFSISGLISVFRRAVNDAFQTVKELDAVMTETAVVTKFDVGDMWSQLPTYTDMANELGATIQGSYETLTLFYQQGLKTNQAMQLGAETMKMARIANLDYATATDYMTAALRGFNMELNEASATRVNDVYSKLAATTASDTREISIAMTKTASIANNANMDLETTAALLSQIIETTREAPETAGTAMKTIIARFQELKKAPDEIGEVDGEVVDANKIEGALRTIGVALRDTEGQFRNLDDVFLEIASKWDSLDTNTQRYIATMAAGSRQQSRFIAMMSDYDRTMELVSAANNSAGASQEQFDKTLDSMEAKLNRLRNAWNSFVMGLANSSMIKSLVEGLTNVLDLLNKITDLLGSGTFFDFLTTLGLIVGTLKVGKKALGGLFATFEGVKKVFSKENISNNTETGIRSALARVRSQIVDTFRGATAQGVSEGMPQSGTTDQDIPGSQSNENGDVITNLVDQGMLGKIANKVLKPFAGGQDITSENAAEALQKFNIAILGSVAVIKGVQAISKHLIEKNIETAAERFEKLNNIIPKVSSALSEIDNKLANISDDKETVKQNSFSIQATDKNSSEHKRMVRQTNQIVRDILQEFPEALKDGSANYKNGIWEVTEEFWDNYEDKLLKQQQKLEQLQQYLNIEVDQAKFQDQMNSNFETSSISGAEKTQITKSTSTGAVVGGAVTGIGTVAGFTIAGAELGSFVPVIGTIIGAAIGAILGAGIAYASSHNTAIKGVDDAQLSEAAKIFGEHGYSLNETNALNFGGTDEEKEITKELADIGISFGTLTEAIDGNYTAFNNLANSALLLEASQKEFRNSLIESSAALNDAPPGQKDKVASYANDMLTQDQIDEVTAQKKQEWAKMNDQEKKEYITKGMTNLSDQGVQLKAGTSNTWVDKNGNEYSEEEMEEIGQATYIEEGLQQAADEIVSAIQKASVETVDAIYDALGKNKPKTSDKKEKGSQNNLTPEQEKALLTRDLTEVVGVGESVVYEGLSESKANEWYQQIEDNYGLTKTDLAALVGKKDGDELELEDVKEIQERLLAAFESDSVQALRQQDGSASNISSKTGDTEIGTLMAQMSSIGSGGEIIAEAISRRLNELEGEEGGENAINAIKDIFYNSDFSSLEGISSFLQQLINQGVNLGDNFDFKNDPEILANGLKGLGSDFNKQQVGIAQINEEAAANNIDTQQLSNFASELQKVNEGLNTVQASELALANTKLNDGLSEIISSYEQWSSLIDSSTGTIKASTNEDVAAFNNLKKSVNKMLNTSEDLSDAFWDSAKNMDNLKKAAEGDTEAIEALQKAAAADYLQNLDLGAQVENVDQARDAINNFVDYMDDIDIPEMKPGVDMSDVWSGSQEFKDAFNDMARSANLSAEQIQNAAKSMGFDAEVTYVEETRKLPLYSQTETRTENDNGTTTVTSGPPVITDWANVTGYFPVVKTFTASGAGGGGISTGNKAAGTKNRGGGGGGGGGSGSSKPYENKYDKRYNLVQDITEEQRTLNRLQDQYNDLLFSANMSAENLSKNYQDQIASLRKAQKLNQQILDYRKKDLEEYLNENSQYSQYGTYNWEDNTIEINWDEIDAIKDEELGGKVDEYISKLEEFEGYMDDTNDTLMEINNQVAELAKTYQDAYITGLNFIKDALVEVRQKEIDKLSDLNDTINDSNSRMFDAIQKAIDDERQSRENDKTEEDIANKEKRLAQLQMDTSGGNQLEILQLQKEIDEAREGYQDSLVDQQLSRMQEEADAAAEQRERQISLLEEQLEIDQLNGEIWNQVFDLWNNGFASDGKLDWSSPLGQLLRETADYQSMSDAEKLQYTTNKGNEMTLAKAGETLGYSDQIDYAEEIEAAKAGTISKQTGIDYSKLDEEELASRKKILEQLRNQKIDSTGLAYEKTYEFNEDPNKNQQSTSVTSQEEKTEQSSEGSGYISSITNQIGNGTGSSDQVKKFQKGYNELIGNGLISGTELDVDGIDGSKTTAAIKQLQKLIGVSVDGYWGKNSRNAFKNSKFKAYKSGGLADFTGPAWLDGTKSHPELVLNARDTENFIQLKDILSNALKHDSNKTENSGDNYFEIHIDVERIEDDYDVEQLASKIKGIIQQDAMYRNVNFINHLR